jgi:hypothetical protein
MKTLREMINSLVLAHILKVFRPGDTGPNDVPFGAVRPDYSKSSCFERINN